MLNFIAMLHSVSNIILCLFLWVSTWIETVFIDNPEIHSPKPGSVVQGVVEITGSTNLPGFQSYELLFSYAIDDTNSWFLIQQNEDNITSDPLGSWDTSLISDGNYRLMLRVNLDNNTSSETIITGIRVRNYTPIETSTPEPSLMISGAGDTEEAEIGTTHIFSQERPSSPAIISPNNIFSSIIKAILFSVLALIVIGALILFRTLSHRK